MSRMRRHGRGNGLRAALLAAAGTLCLVGGCECTDAVEETSREMSGQGTVERGEAVRKQARSLQNLRSAPEDGEDRDTGY